MAVAQGKFNPPISVRAVLDNGFGITCLSEKLLQRFKSYFSGEKLAYPFPGGYSVTVADGRLIEVRQQIPLLQASMYTPWASVVTHLWEYEEEKHEPENPGKPSERT